jgi:hypothetical protein
MCDPLSIAGVVLTGASTVANSVAASKQAKARNSALAAERIRQKGLDQEADALNVVGRERFTDFDDKRETKEAELADFFTGQQVEADQATMDMSLPPSSSNVTVSEQGRQLGKARDFTDEQGRRLADLRSFGDVLGGISRDQARDATTVGQIGGFKRGSQGVLPLELEASQSAGSGMRMLGDVLNLGGGIALNSGLSGGTVGGIGKPDPWNKLRTVGQQPKSGLLRLFG